LYDQYDSTMTHTPNTIQTQGTHTEYTQKNGVVSKVNKKFISQLTRAQHTLSAAATVPSFSQTFNVCTLGHTIHIHTIIKLIPDPV
jgi:hypothetical protein